MSDTTNDSASGRARGASTPTIAGRRARASRALSVLAAASFLAACGSSSESTGGTGTGTSTGTSTTATPTPPTPEPVEPLPEARFDEARMRLGRRLFHDTRLSGDGTVSCATCHSLDTGGAEHRRTSTGIRGQTGPINSPTVLNSSLNFVQFWDGRAADLEAQAVGPVANPLEMGADWGQVVQVLAGDEIYRAGFEASFPGQGLTQATVASAIAEYERSLLTPSRFDRYLRGERTAITDDERRGYETFRDVGCTTCHRGAGIGGTMYQRMGLLNDYFAERGGPITEADLGRFNVTHDEADRHRFKVPTLRNVALTAPYFHDGSRETLEEAVRVMGHVQLNRELDAEQVRLIVAFLGSLTGELPAHARLPESELPPPTVPGTETPTDPATGTLVPPTSPH